MRTQRLFAIIYRLLDKKSVTAKELSKHFEVSVRTIYRDVDILSESGIPIYMSKGRNGGIALLSNYVLNKTIVNEDEKRNILSALHSLHSFGESSMESTLRKFALFFGEKYTSFLEIDYKDWGNRIKEPFEKSKQAIFLHRFLSFSYISSQNRSSERIVEPYRIWFKSKEWYLKAFCLERKDLRLFRLTRMSNVFVNEEEFSPRNLDFSMDIAQAQENLATEIVLRIEADMKYRVVDEFGGSKFLENKDGSCTVAIKLIEDAWLYGYILSFGKSATVIKPERIRTAIKKKLQAALENYS